MTEDTPSAQDGCPFCSPPPERLLLQTTQVIGLWDTYAVSPGHALLIPRRHVATWFDATRAEKLALIEAIDLAKAKIEELHQPDGYNIGINSGEAAGQTVFHLHVHVIPRYRDDVPDPRGGVRHVIPGKGNYLSTGVEDMAAVYRVDQPQLLVSGGDDPLRPHLGKHLAQSRAVDVAVAFIKPSGLDELWAHLTDALDRVSRLRILTGDYLGVTDPYALVKLLDLKQLAPERVDLRVFDTARAAGDAAALPLAFHPKAYIFEHRGGTGAAFVGSSNLSQW